MGLGVVQIATWTLNPSSASSKLSKSREATILPRLSGVLFPFVQTVQIVQTVCPASPPYKGGRTWTLDLDTLISSGDEARLVDGARRRPACSLITLSTTS